MQMSISNNLIKMYNLITNVYASVTSVLWYSLRKFYLLKQMNVAKKASVLRVDIRKYRGTIFRGRVLAR